MSTNLLGFVFAVLGIWMFVGPKSALDFKAEVIKAFGAKLTYSKKTITFYKYLGLVLLVFGLLVLLGFI